MASSEVFKFTVETASFEPTFIILLKTIIRSKWFITAYVHAEKNMSVKLWEICKCELHKTKSEPARHLQNNPDHSFDLKILFKANNTFKRKSSRDFLFRD